MSIQPYPQHGVAVTCRSFDEYVRMFDLSDADLEGGSILDVASGASSFTAEADQRGYDAHAVDPDYELEPDRLIDKARREIDSVFDKLEPVKQQYDWNYYGSPDQHRELRFASLHVFDVHYRSCWNMEDSVYHRGSLPNLPFSDGQFSLVLCSHFLFLYGDQFDVEFHKQSVDELLRVCRPGASICVYPLLSLRYEEYEHRGTLERYCQDRGAEVTYLSSRLPFIPGSELFMRITKQ